MILVGIGFKLAVVPFHLWTPDIYDGAPAPVTAYIATVSKGAMAVLLVRALRPSGRRLGFLAPGGAGMAGAGSAFPWAFAIIAGLSMFAGNLLALREDNVKRILAYSSIAHLGYLLVAFLAGGPQAVRAVSFYLVAYFATTLGAFAVIRRSPTPDREADSIEDYRGLAARSPWIAGVFTACLLSLAGLPLTAGFVGKFIILRGWRRGAALGPHHHPRGQRHDLDLLLPAHRLGYVPRQGRRGCPGRGNSTAHCNCRRARGPDLHRRCTRRLPAADAVGHRVVHAGSSLANPAGRTPGGAQIPARKD